VVQRTLDNAEINALVYEVEKLYHGTPSGIDNTVIVYQQPVYFIRGEAIQTFTVARPFTVAIGNTGVASPTKITWVCRQGWRTIGRGTKRGSIDRRDRAASPIGHRVRRDRSTRPPHGSESSTAARSGRVQRRIGTLIFAAKQAGASGAKLVGADAAAT